MKRFVNVADERRAELVFKNAMKARRGNVAFSRAEFSDDDEFESEIENLNREDLIVRKIEIQKKIHEIKSELVKSLPFARYHDLEKSRQLNARRTVLIDRELSKRRAAARDALENALPAKRKSEIDWTREFVSMARRILSPDSFRRVEEATECHVADMLSVMSEEE